MSTQTAALPDGTKLTKPAASEKVSLSVINTNTDNIANNIIGLNSQLTYQAYSNIASQSAFDTVLDNALSSAPTNSEVHLRINPSASFGLFTSGEVYLVDMKKTASTTYSTAIILQTGAKNVIKATRNSNGWSYDSMATHIKLDSNDTTWANIWAKLNMLSIGETATFVSTATAATSALTGGARSTTMQGIVSRYASSQFEFLVKYPANKILAFRIASVSSSSAGTYSENDIDSQKANEDNSYLLSPPDERLIPANTDLDTYKTIGTFLSRNATNSATLVNTPVTTGGFKLIVERYNGNASGLDRQQRLVGDQLEFIRRYASSSATWSEWKRIAYTNQVLFEISEGIPANSDLNNYTSLGSYYSTNATRSATLSHCPFTIGGFRLLIIPIATGSRMQFIIPNSSTGIFFMRRYDGSAWDSGWFKFQGVTV